MRGRIKVDANSVEDGGSSVRFDGELVEFGMNVVETFMVIGGLLAKRGPTVVEMGMKEPKNPGLSAHWQNGYRAKGKTAHHRTVGRKTVRKVVSRRKRG